MARPEVSAVKKVTSIGGGPIGAGWAAHFLSRGYDVSGYVHAMSEEAAYRKVLDTDAARFGGSGFNRQERVVTQLAPCQGYPCHIRLDLPPLGALFFELAS